MLFFFSFTILRCSWLLSSLHIRLIIPCLFISANVSTSRERHRIESPLYFRWWGIDDCLMNEFRSVIGYSYRIKSKLRTIIISIMVPRRGLLYWFCRINNERYRFRCFFSAQISKMKIISTPFKYFLLNFQWPRWQKQNAYQQRISENTLIQIHWKRFVIVS